MEAHAVVVSFRRKWSFAYRFYPLVFLNHARETRRPAANPRDPDLRNLPRQC